MNDGQEQPSQRTAPRLGKLKEGNSNVLILSRLKGERVIIGDNIAVTVVDIRGDKIRLGIEAPGWVPVHRQEVYDAIHRDDEHDTNAKKTARASR